MDVSSYGKLAFGLSFEGSFNPGMDPNAYPEVEVRVNGSSGSIRYDLLSDFDNQFREYSLALSDFVVTSGTLAELKAAVEQIKFQVYIWGDNDDGMTFTLVVDDVRFEE